MPRWWHYLHVGLGLFLLTIAVVFIVGFGVPDSWNAVVLGGWIGAGIVYVLAGVGFGTELGSRRLDGQRFAGVGTILLGGLLIVGFGVGALYRPAVFGAAPRDEATTN